MKKISVAAVLSLAIGIGANTAVFSVAYALLVRPLPYSEPDRLAILWNRSPGLNIQEDWFSTAQYFDIRNGHSGFEELAIALGANFNLGNHGEPERVGVIRVSSNLLPMLGARPLHGQLFVPEDDVPGRGGTAVLSHGFWQRRFGGQADAVGKALLLNGQSFQIAGVLPESFRLPREVLPTLGVAEDGEIFLPLPLPPSAPTTRTREDYNIIGRLKRGVTFEAAQAEMETITAGLRRDHPGVYPPHGGLTFSIVPLHEQVVGDVRQTVLVLSAAVAFVLLIACANVGNLLLSRAIARQKELAVRAALGATRGQMIRLLLSEAVTLSLIGGALGVALAWAGVRWIHALRPADVPRIADIAINWPVLLFALGACVVAGLLAGLAPALGFRHLDLQRTLASAGRSNAGAGTMWGRGGRLRRLLVVAQLGLAVMLLVGAGLLVRTLWHLAAEHPGFNPDRVLTFEITMTGPKYPNGQAVLTAYRDLYARLHATAGVEDAGAITSLPLSGYMAWGPLTVEGRIPPPGETFINADQRIAGSRYFETMGIPLISGRFFSDADKADTERVVIVDEFMARELWPGQDAVGKRIRFGDIKSEGPWQTVVGVVGRVKQYGLDTDGRIVVYLPQTQAPSRAMYVTVRAKANADSIQGAVRDAVRAVDPALPIYRMRTLQTLVNNSMARQRFALQLLGLFALVALSLAAIGTYGVMSYIVAQGRRELGIRLALGATARGIIALVVAHGLGVAALGIIAGLIGAAGVSRVMSTLLFGVPPTDPMTYATAALLLGAVAFGAAVIPAIRASRVDPMSVMRAD